MVVTYISLSSFFSVFCNKAISITASSLMYYFFILFVVSMPRFYYSGHFAKTFSTYSPFLPCFSLLYRGRTHLFIFSTFIAPARHIFYNHLIYALYNLCPSSSIFIIISLRRAYILHNSLF